MDCLVLKFGLNLALTSLDPKTEWIDLELGVSEGLRVKIVIRPVQERINQYLPDLLKYGPTPCIDQFQKPLQSCFTKMHLLGPSNTLSSPV
jgi:hypothetical protein